MKPFSPLSPPRWDGTFLNIIIITLQTYVIEFFFQIEKPVAVQWPSTTTTLKLSCLIFNSATTVTPQHVTKRTYILIYCGYTEETKESSRDANQPIRKERTNYQEIRIDFSCLAPSPYHHKQCRTWAILPQMLSGHACPQPTSNCNENTHQWSPIIFKPRFIYNGTKYTTSTAGAPSNTVDTENILNLLTEKVGDWNTSESTSGNRFSSNIAKYVGTCDSMK